jgi:chemotaxis protein CheC
MRQGTAVSNTPYTELELDALRELANVGSGTASTALSSMLARTVDISVPNARVLPMADAVSALGDPEANVTGIMLGVVGDMDATVLLLVAPEHAARMCVLLGLEADSEYAESALMEIGNIVGSSYINALATMTGTAIEPTPPALATDMLAAIVESVLAARAGSGDVALLLDSDLLIEGEDCSISFLLVPDHGGIDQLLARLGLGR